MATNFIWWSAVALEAVLLFRGVSECLLRKYPLFYFYIGCILATEFLRFFCYEFTPNKYQAFYWSTEGVTIPGSYGGSIEIFRLSWRHHPGIPHMVQAVLHDSFVLAFSYPALP